MQPPDSHPTSYQPWRHVARVEPPKRPPGERSIDFHEVYSLLDEATVQEQASRCIQCPEPTCQQGCPLGNRIPEWLALAAEGRFLEAAELSEATSNMPEICPRVCPQERLCESSCILVGHAEPVCIGAIEKFINEYAFAHHGKLIMRPTPNGLRVAVVGSGPGGLACADELAKLGYEVTIYEAQHGGGGLLLNGIPAFKLDKDVVQRRLNILRARGVKFQFGVRVGLDITLRDLLSDHAAVFIGVGAQRAKALEIPGAELAGVYQALPFLVGKNSPQALDGPPISVSGQRVVVLGGGDTAMDCLRTAVRAEALETVCVYRRDLANMPGSRKEYENALEEGAKFLFQTNPVAIEGAAGKVTAVCCERMELGAPDASGRRKPQPVPGSEFRVPADVVLVAYGFDPEPFPPGSDLAQLAVNEWGAVRVDELGMTSMPGVFSGGDAVRGASLVVHAVRDGRRAAAGIHRFLQPK